MLNAYHWNNDFKTTKESIKISSKFMDIMSVLKLDSHYLKKISKTRTDLCGAQNDVDPFIILILVILSTINEL